MATFRKILHIYILKMTTETARNVHETQEGSDVFILLFLMYSFETFSVILMISIQVNSLFA